MTSHEIFMIGLTVFAIPAVLFLIYAWLHVVGYTIYMALALVWCALYGFYRLTRLLFPLKEARND